VGINRVVVDATSSTFPIISVIAFKLPLPQKLEARKPVPKSNYTYISGTGLTAYFADDINLDLLRPQTLLCTVINNTLQNPSKNSPSFICEDIVAPTFDWRCINNVSARGTNTWRCNLATVLRHGVEAELGAKCADAMQDRQGAIQQGHRGVDTVDLQPLYV